MNILSEWCSWDAWSDCDRSCCGGSRTRSRECCKDGKGGCTGCPGTTVTESSVCNVGVPCSCIGGTKTCEFTKSSTYCKLNIIRAVWGNWTNSGSCIGTCPGRQLQTRNCTCTNGELANNCEGKGHRVIDCLTYGRRIYCFLLNFEL